MRQLVTIAKDGAIHLFVHDGDAVDQVAQLRDPGLDITTLIEIGTTIGSLYEPVAVKSPKRKALNGTAHELPLANGDEPKPQRRRTRSWGFTRDGVLAVIARHPDGCFVEEIVSAYGHEVSDGAKAAAGTTTRALIANGSVRSIPQPQNGRRGRARVKYAPT